MCPRVSACSTNRRASVPKSRKTGLLSSLDGHAVERLLCPPGGASPGAHEGPQPDDDFIAATTLRIGDKRFLVTSEIDAVTETGTIVEMKASNTKRGQQFVPTKVAFQVAVNGSEFVVGCHLSKDKKALEGLEWLPTKNIVKERDVVWVPKGQRARLILERILRELQELVFEGDAGAGKRLGRVVKLTFDSGKSPVLEVDRRGVEVLPV